MAEGFTGNHAETYEAFLMDIDGKLVTQLDLISGKLDWNASLDVPGSGEVDIVTDPQANWNIDRVQIWYRAEQGTRKLRYPLMVGIIQKPDVDTRLGVTTLKFFDKTTLLAEDFLSTSMSFGVGKSAVAAVREVIASVRSPHHIVDSSATIRTAMSWPVGTTKLKVVNDLLKSIHYTPIRADGTGALVSHPIQSNPPVAHHFKPGPDCIAGPVTANEHDLFDIPNRVIGISTADGDKPPLTAARDNVDKESPWSIPSRGRVIARTFDNIDVDSQATLNARVLELLYSSSQVTWKQTLHHLRVQLELNQTIIAPNGWSFNIVQMTQTLRPGDMCETKVTRVDRFLTASSNL